MWKHSSAHVFVSPDVTRSQTKTLLTKKKKQQLMKIHVLIWQASTIRGSLRRECNWIQLTSFTSCCPHIKYVILCFIITSICLYGDKKRKHYHVVTYQTVTVVCNTMHNNAHEISQLLYRHHTTKETISERWSRLAQYFHDCTRLDVYPFNYVTNYNVNTEVGSESKIMKLLGCTTMYLQ